MICPVTGKECNKPRVYHFTESTENELRAIDLCEECANIYLNQTVPSKKLLDKVFQLIFTFMKQYQPGILGVSDKACPSCGTMLSEVKQSGMLGCSNCQKFFGAELDYFFTQAQSSKEEVIPSNPQDALNAELQKAIEEENYEKAARIRDQLKSIK